MSDSNDHPLLRSIALMLEKVRWGPSGMIVAASGGPDSTALLLALNELQIRPLVVAHINHRLRGAASDGDEEFVAQLAQRLNLPMETRRIETRTEAGVGLEAAARRIRYEALQQVAADHGLSTIATGHTAEDQVETVLFRIIRGTGLRGLTGIRPRRNWRGLTLLRPMLKLPRESVLDFLKSRNEAYRIDESNESEKFTRNRIRHTILPLLKTLNRDVACHLQRLAGRANEWDRIISQLARRALAKVELAKAGRMVILDAAGLKKISRDLLPEVGRLIWRREQWPLREMSADHWHRFAEVCTGKLAAHDFPSGISVRRLPRVVRVAPGA